MISDITRPPTMFEADFYRLIIKGVKKVKQYLGSDRIYGFINPLKGRAYAKKSCILAEKYAIIPENLTTI